MDAALAFVTASFARVRPGDLVLGVGPIDVQQATLDHVLGLLQRWRAPTVTLRLVREDDS